jgi:hypothetical protein
MALQGYDVDLLDVRQWFDELITAKPQYARYLGKIIYWYTLIYLEF